MKAFFFFLQILSSNINVKKEIAVHITSSIILRRHGFLNISTREIEKKKKGGGGKDTKNMYICININSRSNRIASYIKEHQRQRETP